MNSNKSQTAAVQYQLQHVSAKKQRDSPTSSILKTPTAIFVSNRSSFIRTRRLKFANGPESGKVVKEELETSYDSESTTPTTDFADVDKDTFEQDRFQKNLVEVALSPENKMKISPDSWKAFLEYQKYKDYSSETEKTDYTYSRLSKFRNKEIIPGFRVRPNLSRCPISRNDYHSIYEDRSYNTSFLPEANYGMKTTMYENSLSSHRGKRESDSNSFENSGYYQSEMYDYDGFEDNEALNYDEKYYSTFGDSTKYLRGRKEFVHSSFDIDEQKKNFGTSWGVDETDDDDFIFLTQNEGKTTYHGPKKIGGYLYAIYATIIYGITSIPTLFKDLFSKYILRRKTYPYNYSEISWKPSQSRTYLYGKYKSNEQGMFSTWWYQSFIYALYKKLIAASGNSVKYLRTKYYQASRKGKFFWFFIPLLFLLGFCIVLKDLFPNPDAILNLLHKLFISIWTLILFAFFVFIPKLLFEDIPYFIISVIPNFVTNTVPNFITVTISNLFSGFVTFTSNLSFEMFSSLLRDPLIYAAGLIFDFLVGFYSVTSTYLILFYSFFCVYLSHVFVPVWYIFDWFTYYFGLLQSVFNFS